MREPIYINENGDINVFGTVEKAESYMEAVDVENGEFVVTDADGVILLVSVVTEDVSLFFGLYKGRIKKVRITEGK